MKMIERIRKCIEESGIDVLESGELDNVESINFISAIISMEQEFDIEFPDEYLLIDIMSNIENICYIVKQVIDNKNEEH